MQKARRHPENGAPTACGRTVSGSLSLPCPGCFSPFPHGTRALSVSRECLALADGAACFGQGSSDPALLRVQARLAASSRTGLSPAPARPSRRLPLSPLLPSSPALQPRARLDARGLGWPPFARRYSGGHSCFPLLRLLGCFGSSGSPPQQGGCHACAWRVAPFGHPRIQGCSRLPADFRGLPRPSSPPGAKASSVRPRSLLALARRPGSASPRGHGASVCVCLRVCFLCLPSCQRTAQELRPALVENVGLEPTTPGLQSRCSSRLSQSPQRSPGQTRTADPHIISVVL